MEAPIPRSPEAARAVGLAALLEQMDRLDRANTWLRSEMAPWRTARDAAIAERDGAFQARDRAASDRDEAIRARDSAFLERDEARRTLFEQAAVVSRLQILERSWLHRAAAGVRRVVVLLRGR